MTDNPMTRCEQLEAPAVRVEALTAACRETDALAAATLGVGAAERARALKYPAWVAENANLNGRIPQTSTIDPAMIHGGQIVPTASSSTNRRSVSAMSASTTKTMNSPPTSERSTDRREPFWGSNSSCIAARAGMVRR